MNQKKLQVATWRNAAFNSQHVLGLQKHKLLFRRLCCWGSWILDRDCQTFLNNAWNHSCVNPSCVWSWCLGEKGGRENDVVASSVLQLAQVLVKPIPEKYQAYCLDSWQGAPLVLTSPHTLMHVYTVGPVPACLCWVWVCVCVCVCVCLFKHKDP